MGDPLLRLYRPWFRLSIPRNLFRVDDEVLRAIEDHQSDKLREYISGLTSDTAKVQLDKALEAALDFCVCAMRPRSDGEGMKAMEDGDKMVQNVLKLDEAGRLPIEDLLQSRAVSLGASTIKFLLDHEANGSKTDVNCISETTLRSLIQREDLELMKLLFDHGLDVTKIERDYSGTNLVSVACNLSDTYTLKTLIKAHANPRVFGYEPAESPWHPHDTPVYSAALAPNSNCMRFLLEEKHFVPSDDLMHRDLLRHLCTPDGLEPRSIESRGWDKSTKESRMECIDLLLTHGLPVNMHVADCMTLLVFAAREGYIPVMKLLLRHNALVDLDPWGIGTPLKMALAAAWSYKICPSGCVTCSENYSIRIEVAKCLMSAGADLASAWDHRWWPRNCVEQHAAVSRFMYVRPSLQSTWNHRSPLCEAERQPEAIGYFITARGELAPPDGRSPVTALYHFILELRSADLLKHLFRVMRHSPRPLKYRNMSGRQYIRQIVREDTWLTLALVAAWPEPAVVRLLLNHGARASWCNEDGHTLLMAVMRTSNFSAEQVKEVCGMLLARGADPYAEDRGGLSVDGHPRTEVEAGGREAAEAADRKAAEGADGKAAGAIDDSAEEVQESKLEVE